MCTSHCNREQSVYNYLISLDPEIQLVWKAPWKLGKFLYLLTRYLAFAGAAVKISLNEGRFLSSRTCDVLSETMSLILFLRVWAIWGNSRKVACLLIIGFLIPAPIAGFNVLLRTPQSQNNSDLYESIIHSKFGLCPPSSTMNSKGIIVMFAYLAIYETDKETWSIRKSYFFYIQILPVCPQAAIHSILTSHMLLHIRQEALDAALPTTQFSQSLRFGSGPLNEDESENENGQRIQSRVSQQLVTEDVEQSWFGGPLERLRSQVSTE
ncbi:hypothetical protein K435DRAFT_788832 [Dendrothele bispora CBS 962.96]|uniref:DUF6533 domain-containing protein n=1 Tax=Dendrothele bispora (strain CBS 962.96) TaxID=1314807 RepID=A0A4S8MUX8_DENBC|nr:hypothetical protein K435DRAFT_788832 [Dendrothele bispora CBS 962.96]